MEEVNFPRVLGLLEVVIKTADFNLGNIRAAAMTELKEIDDKLKPDPIEFQPNIPFPREQVRAVPIGGAHSPQGPAGFTDAAGNVVEEKSPEPIPLEPLEPPPPIIPEEPIERRV